MNPGSEPPQQDVADTSAQADDPAVPDARRRGPSWLTMLGVALLLMVLVRGFLAQSFYVPSGSMEPAIAPGDRILVNKLVSGDDLRRGDVVVFDGTDTFAVAERDPHEDDGPIGRALSGGASLLGIDPGEQDFVKRVVGLPGDRVVCCDGQGRITVNGTALDERYLFPGDDPSDVTFDVTVPQGRLWLLGDHRGDSADSRAHLGDPGGGAVRVDDVVGRASATYWPLTRLGLIDGSATLASVPRAAP
jgi:signal peptidase I